MTSSTTVAIAYGLLDELIIPTGARARVNSCHDIVIGQPGGHQRFVHIIWICIDDEVIRLYDGCGMETAVRYEDPEFLFLIQQSIDRACSERV